MDFFGVVAGANKMNTMNDNKNKNGKTLKQRITQIAKDFAETCWDLENGDDYPKNKSDLMDALDDYVGSLSAEDDDDFDEKCLLLAGAIKWGCDDNPWVDWDEVLEYVEALNDAVKKEKEDNDSDDGFEDCDCGFTHHYEDKCPVGKKCEMYDAWKKQSEEKSESDDDDEDTLSDNEGDMTESMLRFIANVNATRLIMGKPLMVITRVDKDECEGKDECEACGSHKNVVVEDYGGLNMMVCEGCK